MNVEKLKSLINSISVLAIPIVTVIIGNRYTESIKEREIQGKYVALAIDILKCNPSDENKNLRGWAVEVIDKYSTVKVDPATKKDLIRNIPLQNKSDDLYSQKMNEIGKFQKEHPAATDSLGTLFLELAQLGIHSGNVSQAKATLMAIIENHPEGGIRDKAQLLLDKIDKK